MKLSSCSLLPVLAAVASQNDETALLQSQKFKESLSVTEQDKLDSNADAAMTILEGVVNDLKSTRDQDAMLLNLYRRASQTDSSLIEKLSKTTAETKSQLIEAGLKSSKVMAFIESIPEADRRALFLQFGSTNKDLIQDNTLAGKSRKQNDQTCRKKKNKDAEKSCKGKGKKATTTTTTTKATTTTTTIPPLPSLHTIDRKLDVKFSHPGKLSLTKEQGCGVALECENAEFDLKPGMFLAGELTRDTNLFKGNKDDADDVYDPVTYSWKNGVAGKYYSLLFVDFMSNHMTWGEDFPFWAHSAIVNIKGEAGDMTFAGKDATEAQRAPGLRSYDSPANGQFEPNKYTFLLLEHDVELEPGSVDECKDDSSATACREGFENLLKWVGARKAATNTKVVGMNWLNGVGSPYGKAKLEQLEFPTYAPKCQYYFGMDQFCEKAITDDATQGEIQDAAEAILVEGIGIPSQPFKKEDLATVDRTLGVKFNHPGKLTLTKEQGCGVARECENAEIDLKPGMFLATELTRDTNLFKGNKDDADDVYDPVTYSWESGLADKFYSVFLMDLTSDHSKFKPMPEFWAHSAIVNIKGENGPMTFVGKDATDAQKAPGLLTYNAPANGQFEPNKFFFMLLEHDVELAPGSVEECKEGGDQPACRQDFDKFYNWLGAGKTDTNTRPIAVNWMNGYGSPFSKAKLEQLGFGAVAPACAYYDAMDQFCGKEIVAEDPTVDQIKALAEPIFVQGIEIPSKPFA